MDGLPLTPMTSPQGGKVGLESAPRPRMGASLIASCERF